mmetsp:Transcript_12868/g.41083  ORF Transcript_12868/g.41083 Transcript_12868/m.41083 type:complete len:389 (+) Transcript_12868:156-1322(+)
MLRGAARLAGNSHGTWTEPSREGCELAPTAAQVLPKAEAQAAGGRPKAGGWPGAAVARSGSGRGWVRVGSGLGDDAAQAGQREDADVRQAVARRQLQHRGEARARAREEVRVRRGAPHAGVEAGQAAAAGRPEVQGDGVQQRVHQGRVVDAGRGHHQVHGAGPVRAPRLAPQHLGHLHARVLRQPVARHIAAQALEQRRAIRQGHQLQPRAGQLGQAQPAEPRGPGPELEGAPGVAHPRLARGGGLGQELRGGHGPIPHHAAGLRHALRQPAGQRGVAPRATRAAVLRHVELHAARQLQRHARGGLRHAALHEEGRQIHRLAVRLGPGVTLKLRRAPALARRRARERGRAGGRGAGRAGACARRACRARGVAGRTAHRRHSPPFALAP